MRSFFSKFKFFSIVLFCLSAIIIYLFYNALQPNATLPIYQPSRVNPELVDASIQYVKKYHTIADFSLINQNGETITQEDYSDKIYIADFFFTTCPTICPVMTKNLVAIQNQLKNDDVMLLSHSVTPEIDSLARKSYMAVKTDGDGGPYDMIHTENFVLVDKKRQVRGYYDGTKTEDIDQLMEDLKLLQASYN
ncbi:SCO1 [Nymphon striatum]|nr:SCO1 [Nymphon striatum]